MIDNQNLQNPALNSAIELPAQIPVNPGIKPSGAPVPFSPKSQNTITSAFGNPIANSYDRNAGGSAPTPAPIINSDVPQSNF